MRFTITADMPDNARKRLRHALRLMGATTICIVEVPAAKAVKPVKPDNAPTKPEPIALAALFRRKPAQPWADDEITAYRSASKRGVITMENIDLITRYYTAERRKPDSFCRTSLLTLLRHFDGELDKAKEHASRKTSTGPGWAPAGERKVVPMVAPPLTAAEQEEAAKFQALLDERKARAL